MTEELLFKVNAGPFTKKSFARNLPSGYCNHMKNCYHYHVQKEMTSCIWLNNYNEICCPHICFNTVWEKLVWPLSICFDSLLSKNPTWCQNNFIWSHFHPFKCASPYSSLYEAKRLLCVLWHQSIASQGYSMSSRMNLSLLHIYVLQYLWQITI